MLTLRPVADGDRPWVASRMVELWGEDRMVNRGTTHIVSTLPGFIADLDGEPAGLLTYHVQGVACEIVTLNSWREGAGVGSALIAAALDVASEAGCTRLWLITTNDNLHALRFYQRRGFRLAALHRDAVTESRKQKPSISLIGLNGIPIRDEIELEMSLTS
jgi:ribosomal protein S18 acetylase RimI-like enzyme